MTAEEVKAEESPFEGLTKYVAWFSQFPKPGMCMGCNRARPIYMGYNGGQPMQVTMCIRCKGPYMAWCQEEK